jgi:hypothetical protein
MWPSGVLDGGQDFPSSLNGEKARESEGEWGVYLSIGFSCGLVPDREGTLPPDMVDPQWGTLHSWLLEEGGGHYNFRSVGGRICL